MALQQQKVQKARTVSAARVREIIGFIPHEKQLEVLKHRTRFTTMCWGRRSGKTYLIAYIALLHSINSNQRIWITAPTYDLAKRSWEYLLLFTTKFNKEVGQFFKINKADSTITTYSGSTIALKSADNPASLLGAGVDLLIIDEAARVNQDVWETYLRPTLSDRQGKAIFISTPFGKNWFYDMKLKGLSDAPEHKDFCYFHMATKENTSLPHIAKEVEAARQDLPVDIYMQEYEAEFIDGAGVVFRGVRDVLYDAPNINKEMFPYQTDRYDENHIYQGGLDLARLTDFTVGTIVNRTYTTPQGENKIKVVAVDRFNQLDWAVQKPRIKLLSQTFNNPRTIAERNSIGDSIISDLPGNFEPFTTTAESKKDIINNLAILIEQKKILIPNIPQLVAELEGFTYEISKSGVVKYGARQGLHDDMVMSLALACKDVKPITNQITRPELIPETSYVEDEY